MKLGIVKWEGCISGESVVLVVSVRRSGFALGLVEERCSINGAGGRGVWVVLLLSFNTRRFSPLTKSFWGADGPIFAVDGDVVETDSSEEAPRGAPRGGFGL